MPKLLSGSTLRRGGSGEFIDLKGAQPQLPPTATTETGFTLVTDGLFRTEYRSSLGFIEFEDSQLKSAKIDGMIKILATGTTFYSLGVDSGNLVVEGGVGIGGNIYIEDDAVINELTVGKGYEGQNNVVLKGTFFTPETNEEPDGKSGIAIGWNALNGLPQSYRNIAIGNFALSSGTKLSNNIALGHNALRILGIQPYELLGTITNISFTATQAITTISNADPAVVNVIGHGLSNGDRIYINDVVGLTTSSYSSPFHIVNNRSFYANVLNGNEFELFVDKNLTISLDTSLASSYSSSGTIVHPILLTIPGHSAKTATNIIIQDVIGTIELNGYKFYVDKIDSNTIALYKDILLIEPEDGTNFTAYIGSGTISRVLGVDHNIAIGVKAGESLIDGSRNFFIGDEIARNLTTGSNNFFLGHQVANNVITGSGIISIGGDNIVDGKDNQINIGSVFYFDGDGYATINAETTLGLGSESTSTQTGGAVIIGGIGVAGNAFIGGKINVLGTQSSSISSDVASSDTATGALTVVGGVGIGGDLYVGGTINGTIVGTIAGVASTATNLQGGNTGSIPYQSSPGVTEFLPIGSSSTVLTSDGSTATWVPITSLTASTASEALTVLVGNLTTSTTDTFYIGFTDAIGDFSPISSDQTLYYNTSSQSLFVSSLNITTTTFSTSTTSNQAMTIEGGLGVKESVYVANSIYSAEGISDYGNLVYTPKTTVDSTPPVNPKIGDWWVEADTGVFYQFIKDGTSTFWLQII